MKPRSSFLRARDAAAIRFCLGVRFCAEVLSHHDGNGLRGLLAAHPEEILELAVCSASALEDMDTPADYQRQKEWLAPSVTPEPAHPRDQSG